MPYKEIKKYTVQFGGRDLTAEFSNLAEQANGSVLLRYGETVVFATAVMSKNPREGGDFFPLTVDYEEKYYAAGQILGSRFVRREGRPSEEAILVSRVIDRTLRPLFNKKTRNEVQIVVMALSVDGENNPVIPAILAASLAVATSNIPWGGPVAALRVGKTDASFIINPTSKERENGLLDLIVCGKDGKINMVEGGLKELSEKEVSEAFDFIKDEMGKIQKFQEKIIQEIGKEKEIPPIKEDPEGARELFEKHFYQRLSDAIYLEDKSSRVVEMSELKKEWREVTKNQFGEGYNSQAENIFEEAIDRIIHLNILEKEKRPDGRKLDELRPLYAASGALKRAHGSGLFFRGETHLLSVATLGAPEDVLIIEGMQVQMKKRFMHHYNFPPFSAGETGAMRGPGRREIGHGALAERALEAIIPSKEEFPYTIRLVSETLSSNGSTSMGAVCASTLALMDAGVPIKNPAAGISMGLIMENEKTYKILTDIQGPEDHHGDMDFKIAGTKKGITALQMDTKIEGILPKVLSEALEQARKAREKILQVIHGALPGPRGELSPYAPRVIKHTISPDRIRDLIGPGGRTIQGIIETNGVEINVEQTGIVWITGKTEEDAKKALDTIKKLTREITVGEVFEGKVTRVFNFGAMVEIGPKQEGLIHISELSPQRVERVTDIVDVGDTVPVKVIGIDELGRVNLSLREVAIIKPKIGQTVSHGREEEPPTRSMRPQRGQQRRRGRY